MRMRTAAQSKGGLRSRATQDEPREGTRLRRVYDALLSDRGEWVSLGHLLYHNCSHNGALIRQLRDFYGMDIEVRGRAKPKYRLVGEWFGRTYVSYVKEQGDAEV
jgi:hypothetical protein